MTKKQKARFHKRLGETLTILYEGIKDRDSKQRLNTAYGYIFSKIRNKSLRKMAVKKKNA